MILAAFVLVVQAGQSFGCEVCAWERSVNLVYRFGPETLRQQRPGPDHKR
jgi:hypothetical protein